MKSKLLPLLFLLCCGTASGKIARVTPQHFANLLKYPAVLNNNQIVMTNALLKQSAPAIEDGLYTGQIDSIQYRFTFKANTLLIQVSPTYDNSIMSIGSGKYHFDGAVLKFDNFSGDQGLYPFFGLPVLSDGQNILLPAGYGAFCQSTMKFAREDNGHTANSKEGAN